MKELNLKQLYKIEWTLADNANGWVEPTTYCQLRCPKCFRAVDEPGHSPKHRLLAELKQEVDKHKNERNVGSITLAGGEPLLYPQIFELIEYCKIQNLKVRVSSNGVNLNEELLERLKKAGVSEILIHLDKYQGRGTKSELLAMRQNFCDLFRKVGGVNLGFTSMIYDVESDDVDELVAFYQSNADIVLTVIFIFIKDVAKDSPEPIQNFGSEKLEQLVARLNKLYRCRPSAYMGKLHNKELPALLVYAALLCGTEPIGAIDNKIHAFNARLYRTLFKRHQFLTSKKSITFFKLLPVIFNRNIRLVLGRFLRKNVKDFFVNKLNYQLIFVNFGPDKNGVDWELCEGCPDAMYYDNKLVPSCLLERVKRGDDIQFKI